MKLKRLLPFMLVGALALSVGSCKKDKNNNNNNNNNNNGGGETYELSGNITSDKTLTADKVWTLKGYVYVKDGAKLIIPAGTIIKSDVVEKGALIVERGGKIMAEGTSSSPIVFTSGVAKGQRRAGDWGGIIILGKAHTNRSSEPIIEGGVDRNYGGNDDADNSGVLRYVRIEFAGIAASPGSEINGLTLGGVGSGTVIDHVMVSYGNDDGFEFFGGSVNAKHLIAFACADDDFDFDFGYNGNIQYGLSVKHPQYADIADASNGIECDNDGTGTAATPYTHPHLSNFTFIGPNGRSNTAANHNFANRWRRATEFDIVNSIMIGHQKGGFSMESSSTAQKFVADDNKFRSNLVHAITKPFIGVSGTATDSTVQALCIARGCVKLDSANAAKLSNPWSTTAPSFLPQSGSPATATATYSASWIEPVNFVGAMGATDWTTGWMNFDPNNADY